MFNSPHPEATGSYGDQAVEWIDARMAADVNAEGDALLWHQWLILQRSLEHRADGSLCWPLVLCKMPRQQGKTVLLAELALWRSGNAALFGEEQRVLHAARVASLADMVQGRAFLWAEDNGMDISRRKADSYITWPDGSYWHVMALSAVWGQRVSLALLDEGWDMQPTQFWSGLWPAMAQRKRRQAWVFSAANDGDRGLLHSLRMSERTLVVSWGAPVGADLSSEAVWHAATPYMTDERLEGMRIASTAPGFAIEWLNIDAVGSDGIAWIPEWASCAVAQGGQIGGIGAIEVSTDRSQYGTAVAMKRSDGSVDVWTATHPDLAPALAWLAEREPWKVLAGASLESQVVGPYETEGVGVRQTHHSTPTVMELVQRGRLRHDHNPQTADQVAICRTVEMESGPLLSAKRSQGPIGTAKAMGWAVWEAAVAKEIEQPFIG